MVSDPQRCALRILAGSADGCTEAVLLANGVTVATMVALVKAGYVDVRVDQLARPKVEIVRLVITPAGRAAIG
jgi:hypothetical protein